MSPKINTKILAAVLMLSMIVPVGVNAQTVSQFQPQTREQIIAYLFGQIVQLQILLAEKIAEERSGSSSVSSRSSNNRSEIEVTTLAASSIEEDEADLRGEIDLDGEREASVWFEYGEDDNDLDFRTGKMRITDSRGDERTFRITIDDLDDNQRYYFRAVAEDEDRDRDFGKIQSFTTDEDNSRSNSSNDFELEISDYEIEEGDRIRVEWSLPNRDVDKENWIGVYEVGQSNRNFVEWKYITTDDGKISFIMKDEGEYEFRLFLENSYEVEVTSDSFVVD